MPVLLEVLGCCCLKSWKIETERERKSGKDVPCCTPSPHHRNGGATFMLAVSLQTLQCGSAVPSGNRTAPAGFATGFSREPSVGIDTTRMFRAQVDG